MMFKVTSILMYIIHVSSTSALYLETSHSGVWKVAEDKPHTLGLSLKFNSTGEQYGNERLINDDPDALLVVTVVPDMDWKLQFVNERVEFTAQDVLHGYEKNLTFSGYYWGYTQLSFYLTRDDLDPAFENKTLLRDDLKIVVDRGSLVVDTIFIAIGSVFVLLNNINMGSQLDIHLIWGVLKKPVGPLCGFLSQFICMPTLTWIMGRLLFSDPLYRLGLFTYGCSPGGTGSNFWTLMFNGDINLSITMTAVSTVAAMALLYLHAISQGVLEIRSEATGLYLCMNSRGKLYASCNLSSECEFMKQLEDTYYDTLQSRLFQGRYIAIATNGRIKRARRLRGPLGKEHFFLSRKVQLGEVHRIIERYHKSPDQRPPQRCACYNMTSGGSYGGRHACTGPTPSVTVSPAPPPSSTTTTRPTRCRVINGQKRCRKRRKKCKSKKCRKRRKRRRRTKKNQKRKVKEQEAPSPVATVEVRDIQRRKKVSVRGDSSRIKQHRYSYPIEGRQRQANGSVPTPNSLLQARQVRHQYRHHKYPSFSLTTPTPSSRSSTLRLSSRRRRPRLGTITSTPSPPFPSAPSSAHPHRVRHAHNTRRQRKSRGQLISPTSVTA